MSLGCWILECKRATGIDGVGDGRTSTDDDDAAPSSALATPARAIGVVSSSCPLQTMSEGVLVRAVLRPAALLLRSELRRRFVSRAGVDGVRFVLDLLPHCRSIFCGFMSPWIYLCLLPATARRWLAWLAATLGDRRLVPVPALPPTGHAPLVAPYASGYLKQRQCLTWNKNLLSICCIHQLLIGLNSSPFLQLQPN